MAHRRGQSVHLAARAPHAKRHPFASLASEQPIPEHLLNETRVVHLQLDALYYWGWDIRCPRLTPFSKKFRPASFTMDEGRGVGPQFGFCVPDLLPLDKPILLPRPPQGQSLLSTPRRRQDSGGGSSIATRARMARAGCLARPISPRVAGTPCDLAGALALRASRLPESASAAGDIAHIRAALGSRLEGSDGAFSDQQPT